MKLKIKLSASTTKDLKNWRDQLKHFKHDIDLLEKDIMSIGIRNIQNVITERGLIKSGDLRSSTELDAVPTDEGVDFISRVKYASYVNRGVRPHIMKYLRGKGPIPLPGDMLRTATDKSFDSGAWRHPGTTKGKGFMQEAIARTLREIRPRLIQLRKKMRGKK